MVGNLLYNKSDETEGCRESRVKSLIDSADKEKPADESTDGNKVGNFVLMDRGMCTFVSKTRNVLHTGGNLAIIIDN